MATKIEVLAMSEYESYIMMGMIQVDRDVIAEPSSTSKWDHRKNFAKQILQNPYSFVQVFKSLVIVDLDTTNWGTFSEVQKISGAKVRVALVFNEAGNI